MIAANRTAPANFAKNEMINKTIASTGMTIIPTVPCALCA